MNLNAKWTILLLFAAAGLATSGCTVTTDDGYYGYGGSCAPDQAANLISYDCQACLEANCCGQLAQCFEMSPAVACDNPYSPSCMNCNDYSQCVNDCYLNPGNYQTPEDCRVDICDAAVTWSDGRTAPIADAYDSIISCANNVCSNVCGGY